MTVKENITGVQHLGIIVSDVDVAIKFYVEKLGFQLIHRKLVLDAVDGAIDAAFVKLGDCVLELYKPLKMECEIENRSDGILDHFAIDTGDVDDASRVYGSKGLKLHASTADGIVDYVHVGKNGVRGVNYVGSHGEVVELCQTGGVDYRGRTGLLGWSHLAIKVRDLKRSVEFYEKLGFTQYDSGYLDTPDGRLLIAFVECKGFCLEIIQVCGAMLDDLNKRSAGHIDHFAMDVTDVKEAFAEAKKAGMKIVQPVVKELNLFEHGVAYFTIVGPDGEFVELNQKKKY